MSKNAIMALVGVVIVAGAGWYFYSQKDGVSMTGSNSETAMGSLKDLMARGSSKCTVSNTVENSVSQGVVYIGDGKMRGDFTSTMTNPAMTIESHMISDGEFVYTWSSSMPQGIKIAVSATEGQSSAPESDTVDLYNAQVSYDCDSWSVDTAMFELPSGVTFTDLSSMMKSMPGAGANVQGGASVGANAQQCAACDMAPEPQKSQCRAALKCQ